MNDKWDDWNASGGPKYPQETVIQFCFRHFPTLSQRSGLKALDLGCGSGANLTFLAAEGFAAHGTDISRVAISNADQRLRAANLQAQLRAESAEVVAFPAEWFDLIICVGVYECVEVDLARQSIERVHAVLKPGGRGLFLFCAENDFRISHTSLNLHGYSDEEVRSIFKPFCGSSHIDLLTETRESGAILIRDYVVNVWK